MTTTPSPLSHPKYRPDIDGLRAVAVLSVVAFHAFPERLKGGFIGVDVFFVISGFLISTIIFENLDKGTFSFAEFYARRIKRIFPALLLVLAASIAFGWVALLADEYKQLGKHTVAGVGFLSNFILWREAGYFDNAAETKVLLHLWSLGIEEQFYIIWPLLSWFFWKVKFRNIFWLIIVFFASFLLNIYTVAHDGVEAFYSPFTRFWELLSGGLLSFITLYHRDFIDRVQRSRAFTNGLSLFGAFILGLGFLFVNKESSFPGFWALMPVAGAALIIFSGPQSMLARLFLTNKIAVWFGLISFPLYLWHWPLLTFLRIVQRSTPDSNARIVAVFLSIFLAWLTYWFIEKKVRRSCSYKPLVPLILLGITLFACGSVTYYNDGFPDHTAAMSNGMTKEVQRQFMGPIWSYTKNDICLSEYPYKDQDSLAWWFCMKSGAKPPTILLLGNSFANQLYPGFAKNEKLGHHTILSIGTCSVGADGHGDDPRNPCYGARAKEQADFIDNIIKKTPTLKFVILDGLLKNPDQSYIDRVIKRVGFLEKQGLNVIVFTPHLRPDFDPKACFKSPLNEKPRDCLIQSAVRKEILSTFSPLTNAIGKRYPNVHVFEQNEVFCDRKEGNCSYVRDGLPLNRDETHTSEYASLLLRDYFNKWALENIPSIFDPSLTSK